MTFEMIYLLLFVLFVVIVVIPGLSTLAQWVMRKSVYAVAVYQIEEDKKFVIEISYSRGFTLYTILVPENQFYSEEEAFTFAEGWLEENTN